MCRAICIPMAPRPITPVRFTLSPSAISLVSLRSHAHAALGRPRLIDRQDARHLADHHPVSLCRRRNRYVALTHIGEHSRRIARERVAVAAAAGCIEAKGVARL